MGTVLDMTGLHERPVESGPRRLDWTSFDGGPCLNGQPNPLPRELRHQWSLEKIHVQRLPSRCIPFSCGRSVPPSVDSLGGDTPELRENSYNHESTFPFWGRAFPFPLIMDSQIQYHTVIFKDTSSNKVRDPQPALLRAIHDYPASQEHMCVLHSCHSV